MALLGLPPLIAIEVGVILFLLMVAATLMGRPLARLLPYRLRPRAVLFLSPALGLGLLVLVAAHVGRVIGFATVPTGAAVLTACGATLALMRERRRAEAALHAAIVAAVSFVAGSAILMCILRTGGFDAGNDSFTYLVHGNWLQTHAFMDTIPRDLVTPYSSQVAIYQNLGFRMGASYLLGWVQAMAGLQWSYVAYPVVAAAAAGAFSVAAVFSASLFVRLRPLQGYLLACLPGIGAGSLVFAIIKGFLPQAMGGVGALAFLALAGAMLTEFSRPSGALPRRAYWPCGIVLGGLFAVSVVAYSEQTPFLACAALLAIAAVFANAQTDRVQLTKLVGVSIIAAVAFMNVEVVRAAQAILIQSGAIVGWGVDWSIFEFLAHAVGIHGGSGDVVEWIGARPGLDIVLMIAFAALAVWAWRRPRASDLTNALPLVCFAALCAIAFVYFRYFVPAPFSVGTGQSWNDFKLTGWAYPAVAVLLAATLARLWVKLDLSPRLVSAVLTATIIAGLWQNYALAAVRMAPARSQLGTDAPVFATLLNIRGEVISRLQPGQSVYLDLSGDFLKLRQLLAYMLYDQPVTANWLNDGYISPYLSLQEQNRPRGDSAYLIAPIVLQPPDLQRNLLWRIGGLGMASTKDTQRYAAIDSADGGYDREHDGSRWWYWVKDAIVFTFAKTDGGGEAIGNRLSFEYWATGKNRIHLEVVGSNNRFELTLPSASGKGFFNKTLPPAFGPIRRLRLQGDDEPVQLGPNDSRTAKFLIANLEIETTPSSASDN